MQDLCQLSENISETSVGIGSAFPPVGKFMLVNIAAAVFALQSLPGL